MAEAGAGNGSSHDGDEVTVLAVDDHDLFRSAVRQLVRATPGFTLVGETSSGEDSIGAASALHPDLVLMDVHMPGIGGIEATRTILDRHPELVVWLVSVEPAETLAELADSCGAEAYVRKEELRPRVLRERWEARVRTRR